MQSASKGLVVMMILTPLGMWGCAQDKNNANNAKLRDLIARHSKLEEDFRAVSAAHENFKRRVAQLETKRVELTAQLDETQRERDDLKKQLASRTSERDTIHGQLSQFGKELQSLAGRIEAAANASNVASATAANSAAPATGSPAAAISVNSPVVTCTNQPAPPASALAP